MRKANQMKRSSKKQKEAVRLKTKAASPGVPPNTCPYIDLTITMVQDMCEAYEKLRTKGEYNPVIDNLQQHAVDTLEYIRKCNETLRDNSSYWYNQYKDLL